MKEQKEHPLVTRLENLRDSNDRAALARLRRGLGKEMGTPEMYPYVVPFLPAYPQGQESCFLVAALFATHPLPSPRGTSFGASFRRVWEESGRSDSTEKRFTALLSADEEDLGGHLRHAVSLAKSKNTPIDFHSLLYDLRNWSHPDRFVQLRWARDFWRAEKADKSVNIEKKGENE